MKCKTCGDSAYQDNLCKACFWQDHASKQGLTIATLCDLVLGEEAEKRDDQTLIQAVAMLQAAATTKRK